MIRLDARIGSGELERLFQPYGIQVEKTRLDFGDMDFAGWGPHDARCNIVIERKRIDDLIHSMHSRRLSGHQLPGMSDQYDYAYLIVEGIWKGGPDGELLVVVAGGERWVSRNVHVRAVNNYLMGLALRAGLLVWRTPSEYDTVAFVVDQYRMWNDKRWDEHKSHAAIYAPADGGRGHRITLRSREISLLEKLACQLPGVDAKAERVAAHFGTARAMVEADVKAWCEVPGIGKTGAKRIVEALNGGTREAGA